MIIIKGESGCGKTSQIVNMALSRAKAGLRSHIVLGTSEHPDTIISMLNRRGATPEDVERILISRTYNWGDTISTILAERFSYPTVYVDGIAYADDPVYMNMLRCIEELQVNIIVTLQTQPQTLMTTAD